VIVAQSSLVTNQRLATQLAGQQMVTEVYLVKALGEVGTRHRSSTSKSIRTRFRLYSSRRRSKLGNIPPKSLSS